jgi:hypothetical protein
MTQDSLTRRARSALLFLMAVTAAVTLLGLTALAPAAHAATARCGTTHSYRYSVSATGTITRTWTTRAACGRAYQKWEHIAERSRTGSHYTEDLYRDERGYPHYWQKAVKDSWSARGTHKHTVTITAG